MKRQISLFVVLCMVLAMLPVSAFAAVEVASGTCGENLTWTLDDSGKLTISGTGDMYDYNSQDTAPWYAQKSEITSVVIEKGVTSIGERAFYYCDAVSISIPEGVTSIGANAFFLCSELTSITIPESVTSIGWFAFGGCRSLTEITIPGSVTSFGDYIFSDCSSLNSITISEGVTSIGRHAFEYCDSVAEVTIPASVTSIGQGAFAGCAGLERIAVAPGNGVYHSAQNCLIETASKTLIAGCKNSVIPSDGSVTCIDEYAFFNCSHLTEVTIPASVASIDHGAFRGCEGLERITVASGNGVYHSAQNCLIETASKTLIAGCKNSVIPSDGSVTTIGADAFWSCGQLTAITIPDTVTSIGYSAFFLCTELTSITIPEGVTSIGTSAFLDCWGLTSVVLPASLVTIGMYAFDECDALADVYFGGTAEQWAALGYTFPDTVTVHYEGSGAFDDEMVIDLGIRYQDDLKEREKTGWISWGYPLFQEDARTIENSDPAAYAELVKISALLSKNVYDFSDGGNLRQMLNQLGAEAIEIVTSEEDDFANPVRAISHVEFYQGDEQKNVIIVAIRGTQTWGDIKTDLAIWTGGLEPLGEHAGFSQAKDRIKGEIAAYLLENGISASNSKILITGHSYGGAVANLLAKSLEDIFDQSDIYAYTFATPNSIVLNHIFVQESNPRDNIHNFRNTWDPVVHIPVATRPHEEYTVFGQEHFFKLEEIGDDSEGIDIVGNHNCTHYVNYAFNLGMFQDVDSQPTRCVQIHCPVDVTAYDENGNVVGRIVDNQLDEASTGILMFPVSDQKNIFVDQGEDVKLSITATDAGSMDVIITDYDLVTGEVLAVRSYSGIDLKEGKDFYTSISAETAIEDIELEVVDNEGNRLAVVNEDGTETVDISENHTHTTQIQNVKEATCTESGYSGDDVCDECGTVVKQGEEIPSLSHNYESVVTTAPGCTEQGYTTYTCTRCDHSYVEEYVDALGHDVSGEWQCNDLEHWKVCNRCGETIDMDDHTMEGNTCTVCGYEIPSEEKFTLSGANMKLGGELEMFFYIPKAELDGENYYAKIVKTYSDGRDDLMLTIPYANWENYNSTLFRVRLSGISAKEMADEIYVTIYHGTDIAASETWTDSVRAYAMRSLANDANGPLVKTMVVDMLNYGAAAQGIFGYGEDNLANSLLSEEQQAMATQSVSLTDSRVKGENYKGTSLSLKSSIIITFYFENITPDMTAIATYTNHYGVAKTVTIPGSDFFARGNMYGIDVSGLVVADGSQVVTVEVLDADGNVVASASDSIESYVARMSASDALYEMAMKFVTSAYAYLHS